MSLTGATSGPEANSSSPKELASAAGRAVKQEVATFAAAAQEKTRDQVEEKTAQASQTLGDFAAAVRKAGDELSEHDQSLAGRMVRQAADGLEDLARSLSDKRPEDLLEAARAFGRRNPAAFIAGGVLLGLAASRFLRSSASHRDSALAGGLREEPSFAPPLVDELGRDAPYQNEAELYEAGSSPGDLRGRTPFTPEA
jgi:hypothetical protein